MKRAAAFLFVLVAGVYLPSILSAQSPASQQSWFRIELMNPGVLPPSFIATNLTNKTVTACVIKLSFSSGSEKSTLEIWDAILQGASPIKPGASFGQVFEQSPSGTTPDNVEILAGQWDDGSTFGPAESIEHIADGRQKWAAAYEAGVALLQQGLDQNWTRDEYLQALNDSATPVAIAPVRSTIADNLQPVKNHPSLAKAVQAMLASFTQKLVQLKAAGIS